MANPPAMPAVTATDEDAFLGVPDDFVALRRDPTRLTGIRRPDSLDPGITPVAPQYKPGNDVAIADMSVENLARLQQRLAQAGLIGPSTRFRVGRADDATIGAFRNLLEMSNRYGRSWDEMLTELESEPTTTPTELAASVDTGPQVSRTIQEPVFTDPLTARNTLREMMSDKLGRAPTADEYHRFRSMLSNAESGQDISTSTTTTGPDGNTTTRVRRNDDTTDPSPVDVAEKMLRTGKLGKEANTRTVATDYYGVIDRLIGGS